MVFSIGRNSIKTSYYSTFNFGRIFPSSETHPNVTGGSEECSAKVLIKDLALY